MEPATLALVSLIGSTAIKLADDFDIFGKKQKRIDHQEIIKRELQNIQMRALKSLHARRDYASYVSENIILGQQASSLSKSRIGVAGTAPPSFQTIMERFDREREGNKLQYQETMTKLAVQRQSSYIAQKEGFDFGNSVLGGLSTLADFANGLSRLGGSEDSGSSSGSAQRFQ